ncbi:MAG: hypothetical protein JWN68_2827 [Nocardioides sp.]|uniref:cold shock domain-containing protein n=1 Tax=Nocardioides sp. TaxID=35761 RepID=UPI002610E57E|nr:cold shock domain-containing protein [Nocardioides sp.]MCW2834874.1 hypothetical protein [Nocardioides sp.]
MRFSLATAAVVLAVLATGCDASNVDAPKEQIEAPRFADLSEDEFRVGYLKFYSESKGVGVISMPSGEDVPMHREAIDDPSGTIEAGQYVQYVYFVSPTGPRALHVRPMG